MSEQVELVVDAKAQLGEGPTWDAKEQKLIWVDIEPGLIHFYDPKTGSTSTSEVGQKVGTVVSRANRQADSAGNWLILGVHHGFAYFNPASSKLTIINDPESDRPNSRFNDGKCDPAGRFWAGTYEMTGPDQGKPICGLYRLDADGNVQQMLDGVSCSNGITWSGDQTTMYYIDSPTRKIDAFDYDTTSGAIGNRRTVLATPEDFGGPDGMTIDTDGNLWVAFWGKSCVRCIDPRSGRVRHTVRLPVSNVTSCIFGGEKLDELYITSARESLDEQALAEQPAAGGLFRARPGVKGAQAFEYAG